MSVEASSSGETKLVVFALETTRYAVELSAVERVVRMVALTPLPKAPAIVLGVFDLAGALVPVVDARKRFRLPARAPSPADQILILRTARRRVAMVVSDVLSVTTVASAQIASPTAVVPGLEFLRGLVQLPESGIVLIHDVDAFLSLEEEQILSDALEGALPS